VLVCDRLRSMREEKNLKNLSQGDIEKRTGFLGCYVSRVENGHTVPAVETIEKFARALELPVTNSSRTARNLPSFPTFPIAPLDFGEVPWPNAGPRQQRRAEGRASHRSSVVA